MADNYNRYRSVPTENRGGITGFGRQPPSGDRVADAFSSLSVRPSDGAMILDAGSSTTSAERNVHSHSLSPCLLGRGEGIYPKTPKSVEQQQTTTDPSAKSALNEMCCRLGLPLPEYQTFRTGGEDHDPVFQSQSFITLPGGSSQSASASGTSKTRAEQATAACLLSILSPYDVRYSAPSSDLLVPQLETASDRSYAISLLESVARVVFRLDPDLSGEIKAGSFNPYGNGQRDGGLKLLAKEFTTVSSASPYFQILTTNTTTTNQFIAPCELYLFTQALTNVAGSGWVAAVVRWDTSGAFPAFPTQAATTPPSGNSYEYLFWTSLNQLGTSTFYRDYCTPGVTLPSGSALVFIFSSFGADVRVTMSLSEGTGDAIGYDYPVNTRATAITSAPSGFYYTRVLDSVVVSGIATPITVGALPTPVDVVAVEPVEVVVSNPLSVSVDAFGQVNNPVWVSTLDPQAPVMAVPPPMVEGVFNPYGNGQTPSARVRTIVEESVEGRPATFVSTDVLLESFTRVCDGIDGPGLVHAINWAKSEMSRGEIEFPPHPLGYSEGDDSAVAKQYISRKEVVQRADRVKNPSAAVKDSPATSSLHSINMVFSRILKRISSWDDFLCWLCGGSPVSRSFFLEVYKRLKTCKWQKTDCAAKGIIEKLVSNSPLSDQILALGQWHPVLQAWMSARVISSSIVHHFQGRPLCVKADVGEASSVARVISLEESSSSGPAQPHARQTSEGGVLEAKPEAVDVPAPRLEGSYNTYGNEQPVLVGNMGYVHALARSQNSRMHSLNGNTVEKRSFATDMQGIESLSSLASIFEATIPLTSGVMDPVNEVASISGLRGPAGSLTSSTPYQTSLRAQFISPNNVISNTALNHPETLLHPINFASNPWNPNDTTVANVTAPPLYGVAQVRLNTKYPASMSAEGAEIYAQVMKVGGIKPDTLTASSFPTSDIAGLVRLENERNGDSMCSLFLKLWLYEMSRTWYQDFRMLPIAGLAGKHDRDAKLATPGGVPTISVQWNVPARVSAGNAAVDYFNYVCRDGDVAAGAAFFPFEPERDAAGNPTDARHVICFHVTRATVPDNEPWFLVPPGLLSSSERGRDSMNIALLALALAPYPCGLHTVSFDTTNANNVNPSVCSGIPRTDLVHIGGNGRRMHFVLPSKTGGPPPGNVAAANQRVMVRPTAGPSTSGLMLADTQFDICVQGQPLSEYFLCDYLATWMARPPGGASPIDSTSLAVFRKKLSYFFSRTKDMRYSYELACCLGIHYSPLNESVPTPAGQPGAPTLLGNVAEQLVQNFFALSPHLMVENFGRASIDTYDTYVPQLNPIWFNKIASGAFTSMADDAASPAPVNSVLDGSPLLLFYSLLVTRGYAAVAEAIFSYMGVGRGTWNAAFTQTTYMHLTRMIRSFFIDVTVAGSDSLLISDLGEAVASLHLQLLGYSPARDMYGFTLWDYLNSPREGFRGVLSAANDVELDTCIPCVLPDVWVQLAYKRMPRMFTPLLPPLASMSGLHSEGQQMMALTADLMSIPIPVTQIAPSVGLDSIPEIDDNVVFNTRLVMASFPFGLYQMNGAAWNISTMAAGNIPCQKFILSDAFTGDLTLSTGRPSVLVANTRWVPFMSSTGTRLVVGVSVADGRDRMTQIMAGASYATCPTWCLFGLDVRPNTIMSGGGQNSKIKLPLRSTRRSPNSAPGEESASGERDRGPSPSVAETNTPGGRE